MFSRKGNYHLQEETPLSDQKKLSIPQKTLEIQKKTYSRSYSLGQDWFVLSVVPCLSLQFCGGNYFFLIGFDVCKKNLAFNFVANNYFLTSLLPPMFVVISKKTKQQNTAKHFRNYHKEIVSSVASMLGSVQYPAELGLPKCAASKCSQILHAAKWDMGSWFPVTSSPTLLCYKMLEWGCGKWIYFGG